MAEHGTDAGDSRSRETQRLKAYLRDYLEQESNTALDAALSLCRSASFDVGAVLDWIGDQHSDPALKARAVLEVRRAVGLSMRSGPICRTPG